MPHIICLALLWLSAAPTHTQDRKHLVTCLPCSSHLCSTLRARLRTLFLSAPAAILYKATGRACIPSTLTSRALLLLSHRHPFFPAKLLNETLMFCHLQLVLSVSLPVCDMWWALKGTYIFEYLQKKKKWNTPNQIPLSHCMKTPTDIWPLSWMGICTISIHSHIRFLCSHGYLSVPAPISNDGIVNTQVGALTFVPLSGMMLWPAMQGHFALIFMTYTFFLQSKNI